MDKSTCQWPECERTEVFARGLCQRCNMRARRAGVLDQFESAPRVCGHCGGTFRTGKNGKHSYCSFECQRAEVAARREAKRIAELTRPCAMCGETISHTQRLDAIHCSVACQKDSWYQLNPERVAERSREWKAKNRDRAKDSDHKRRARMRGSASGPIDYEMAWQRDGGKCWICSKPVDPTLKYPHPGYKSWDHITPIFHGGSHTMDNIALSHLRCNISKKDKLLDRRPAWAS